MTPMYNPECLHDEEQQWVRRAEATRLQLHLQASEPFPFERDRAFAGMSKAYTHAIQKVRSLYQRLREAVRY